MSSTDPNKPTGKSGQRNRKPEPRSQQKRNTQPSRKANGREKPTELQSSEHDRQSTSDFEQKIERDHELIQEPDRQQDQGSVRPGEQQNEPPGEFRGAPPDQQSKSEPNEQHSPQRDEQDKEPTATLAPGAATAAETLRVNFQTLADAYSDYTRKSLEQTRAFVEKLSGVRSLDKAMEVQAEFAKQSYETFVAGSQRICELQGQLARQAFKPLQRLSSQTPEQR